MHRLRVSKVLIAIALAVLFGPPALTAPADQESNGKLLFKQRDIVTVFPNVFVGQSDGVRVGTVTGDIDGTMTTNLHFNVPFALPNFSADDRALLTDVNGDQMLFRVISVGTFVVPLASDVAARPAINAIAGPFEATYTVLSATGRFANEVGNIFHGRGIGVAPAEQLVPGAVLTDVFGKLKKH